MWGNFPQISIWLHIVEALFLSMILCASCPCPCSHNPLVLLFMSPCQVSWCGGRQEHFWKPFLHRMTNNNLQTDVTTNSTDISHQIQNKCMSTQLPFSQKGQYPTPMPPDKKCDGGELLMERAVRSAIRGAEFHKLKNVYVWPCQHTLLWSLAEPHARKRPRSLSVISFTVNSSLFTGNKIPGLSRKQKSSPLSLGLHTSPV